MDECVFKEGMKLMDKHDPSMEDSLGYIIGKTFRVFQYSLHKLIEYQGYNVSLDQWIIMMVLIHKVSGTQVFLSKVLEKDKTSITRMIDDLESKNYVTRVPGKIDRREKEVFLTENGKDFVLRLLPFFNTKTSEILNGISKEEFSLYKDINNRITANLMKQVEFYHNQEKGNESKGEQQDEKK